MPFRVSGERVATCWLGRARLAVRRLPGFPALSAQRVGERRTAPLVGFRAPPGLPTPRLPAAPAAPTRGPAPHSKLQATKLLGSRRARSDDHALQAARRRPTGQRGSPPEPSLPSSASSQGSPNPPRGGCRSDGRSRLLRGRAPALLASKLAWTADYGQTRVPPLVRSPLMAFLHLQRAAVWEPKLPLGLGSSLREKASPSSQAPP